MFVLHLGGQGEIDNENRFRPDWIEQLHELFDEVESSSGPAALVTTGTGKFFSNGLDVDWIFGHMDQFHSYLDQVHTVFSRILTLGLPTVAAVNGHAFGAGAMLATVHDLRVMRADRGYYCLPEVTLSMPFTLGMTALLTSRLSNQVALTAMTTGQRFGGAQALAAGIVDATVDADAVLSDAVARAAALADRRGDVLAGIKRGIHAPVLTALAIPSDSTNVVFGSAS